MDIHPNFRNPAYTEELITSYLEGSGAELIGELRNRVPELQSRLLTVDIAQRIDGRWTVIELGDGQVSSIGDRSADVERFYSVLVDHFG